MLIFWLPWWFLNSSWISGLWLFPVENLPKASVWFLILRLCVWGGENVGRWWFVWIKSLFPRFFQENWWTQKRSYIFSLFRNFISLEIYVFFRTEHKVWLLMETKRCCRNVCNHPKIGILNSINTCQDWEFSGCPAGKILLDNITIMLLSLFLKWK